MGAWLSMLMVRKDKFALQGVLAGGRVHGVSSSVLDILQLRLDVCLKTLGKFNCTYLALTAFTYTGITMCFASLTYTV